MKTNVTYIDASKFQAILDASGLPYVGQKGFVKVMGPAGRNLYVAATKRVGRVDLSGFVLDDEIGALQKPHMGESGNVKQQLSFAYDEDTILWNFAMVLAHMAFLAPAEKQDLKRAPAAKSDAPKGWTSVPKAAPPAPKAGASSPKANRLAAIKKQATGPVA